MRSITKLICSALCFVSMGTAFSGGVEPDTMEPVALETPRTGVYVDIGLGYAGVDWGNFGQASFNGYNTFSGSVSDNSTGGFTFGADVGYQINKILGLEVGWYYLPRVRGTSNVNAALAALRVDSWLAYLALKVMAPLSKQFSVFGKLGAAYRPLTWKDAASGAAGFGDTNPSYVNGIFGAGLQYYLDENWSITAQYLYMLNNKSTSLVSHRAPSANLATVSIGYIFAV